MVQSLGQVVAAQVGIFIVGQLFEATIGRQKEIEMAADIDFDPTIRCRYSGRGG